MDISFRKTYRLAFWLSYGRVTSMAPNLGASISVILDLCAEFDSHLSHRSTRQIGVVTRHGLRSLLYLLVQALRLLIRCLVVAEETIDSFKHISILREIIAGLCLVKVIDNIDSVLPYSESHRSAYGDFPQVRWERHRVFRVIYWFCPFNWPCMKKEEYKVSVLLF